MDDLPPEACSCSALRQAARHLTRFYDEMLAPTGLGLNQYSILAKVDRHGEMSVQRLAALLVMDRSTLGHLLRPLERRGLLTVRPSTSDGRKRVVALSPEGSALLGSAKPLWKDAEERFQAGFGQDEAAGLRNLMRQVTVIDLQGAPTPAAAAPQ